MKITPALLVLTLAIAACKTPDDKALLGTWQPRSVMDSSMNVIYDYEKRDSIFDGIFNEGREYFTGLDSNFNEEDSMKCIKQATEIVKKMFETTYNFQPEGKLIVSIYSSLNDDFYHDTVKYSLDTKNTTLYFENGSEKIGQKYKFENKNKLRLQDNMDGLYIHLVRSN